MELFDTKHGSMYVLNNDRCFVDSLREGLVFEENIVTTNILPLLNTIPDEKIILDIGGHIGSHTLLYSKYVDNCKIYTFEPQSVLFNILKLNVDLNNLSNVQLFHNAVGHKLCECSMSNKMLDGINCPLEYYTDKTMNYGGVQLGKDGEHVDMITIDSLNLPNCHYIKVDVEGAEILVLFGAIETIRKYKPIIMFEYFANSNEKVVTSEMKETLHIDFHLPHVYEFLINEGYRIEHIDYGNKLAIPNK
jgi:hypothetical protein